MHINGQYLTVHDFAALPGIGHAYVETIIADLYSYPGRINDWAELQTLLLRAGVPDCVLRSTATPSLSDAFLYD